MSIYKSALKKKLRYDTPKGVLTVEQLFDLDLKDLDTLAVSLEEDIERAPKKSFLTETSEEDKLAKLKFEVVFDILETKVAARERALKAAETRQRNKKIEEIILSKKEDELKDKSVEELEAMLSD